jgi:hypothetical protein
MLETMTTHAEALPADVDLFVACHAARAATADFDRLVEADAPQEEKFRAIDREHRAVLAVAAMRPRTPRGFADKAALLAEFHKSQEGCEAGPELVALALAVAEDALALVREMAGNGSRYAIGSE